jgi:hypothetical protein
MLRRPATRLTLTEHAIEEEFVPHAQALTAQQAAQQTPAPQPGGEQQQQDDAVQVHVREAVRGAPVVSEVAMAAAAHQPTRHEVRSRIGLPGQPALFQ